jgi:DNA repair protein RadC
VERTASNGYNPRIREIPSSDRPRERLRDRGAENLSTAELLAIILRTGSADQNVLQLATSLLARHGGLGGLSRLSFADLVRERGLGTAKAAELQALFQLAIRLNGLQPDDRPYVRAPSDVYMLVGAEMAVMAQEELRVLLVSTRNQLLGSAQVYRGSVSSAQIRPGEVLREAVRQNAPSVILVHNHPSGDPSPSPDDVNMTRAVVEAGKLLDIEVLDHVVIGDRRYASLKQLGLGFAP